jgi:hypothetical protein
VNKPQNYPLLQHPCRLEVYWGLPDLNFANITVQSHDTVKDDFICELWNLHRHITIQTRSEDSWPSSSGIGNAITKESESGGMISSD